MYREIDSAELIFHFAGKSKESTAKIALDTIQSAAAAIEEADASIRVNTGMKSLRRFQSICGPAVVLEERFVIINGTNSPAMQHAMRQYGPSGQTIQMIEKFYKK